MKHNLVSMRVLLLVLASVASCSAKGRHTLVVSVFPQGRDAHPHGHEIVSSVALNAASGVFAEVAMVMEANSAEACSDFIAAVGAYEHAALVMNATNSTKLSCVPWGKQPTYHDLFMVAERLFRQCRLRTDLVVISNTDQVFDASLAKGAGELEPLRITALSVTHAGNVKFAKLYGDVLRHKSLHLLNFLTSCEQHIVPPTTCRDNKPTVYVNTWDAYVFNASSFAVVPFADAAPGESTAAYLQAFHMAFPMNVMGAEGWALCGLVLRGWSPVPMCHKVSVFHLHCAPKMHARGGQSMGYPPAELCNSGKFQHGVFRNVGID